MPDPADYTVGWICAISTERVAAEAFLDEKHEGPENVSVHDNNDYALGKMGKHNLAIAVLPDGEYGTASAATVARDMLHTFPNIRIGLMVGIGGGAPSPNHDIRLGDVVVSTSSNGKGGVFQYDFGKTIQGQTFQQTGFLDQPPTVLRTATAGLRAQYEAHGHQLEETINALLAKRRRLQKKYKRPDTSSDRLFRSRIVHPEDEKSCATFCLDDPSNMLHRSERTEDDDNPTVHYGTIASANQLMNDALLRDRLAAEHDVLCFETEAAGLMNHFPCLVIRGICDYSDSHKNAEWQGYAAMAAAAYAKDLLIRIPPKKIEAEKTISSLLIKIDEKILEVDEKIDSISQSILSLNLPVVEEAAFSSYAEQHNPTCLRETRVELLQQILDWARDPKAKSIFWLNGMAGTGKSTVSRTIAQSLVDTGHLGASFFFKRGEGDRGKSAKLFTTIAAQLAIMQPAIAVHIKNAIKIDPAIGNKGLQKQFDKLILEPLSMVSPENGKSDFIVLVIDALDECDLEDDIKLIIRLLNSISNPCLRVFVTSRPELPIRLGFSEIQGEFQHVILHEISEPAIQHDLSIFIRHELQEIRLKYNQTVPEYRQLDSDWPGQYNIAVIVKMAIPLFIFAATICRFLADRKCGNPDERLRKVLEYETKSQESKLDATYLPVLDQQIAGLSARERDKVMQQFQYIVGSIVLLASPLSTSTLAQLLRISRDVIDTRLDMLHSVLSIPESSESPVRLLHLSFRDFLVDPEKRGQNPFWIHEAEAHAKITDNCLHAMKAFLREDMCNLRSHGLEASKIDSQEACACIPTTVQYACLNWVFHLQGSRGYAGNYTETLQFLEHHFLHWVEALSLIQQAPESIMMVKILQALVLKNSNKALSGFLDDALRILQSNLQIIADAPLQIYSSVLLFAPRKSIIRNLFKDKIPKWVSLEPNVDKNWNQCIQILEGHSQMVLSVALSHNSSLIASASMDNTVRIWFMDTGECVRVLHGLGGSFESVTFSHDSSLIASASTDNTVQIWCTDTGECIGILHGHDNSVESVTFSHDSSLVASASRDNTIRLWCTDTGECVRILKGHGGSVMSTTFSHNSLRLASGASDGTVRLWDPDTGECTQQLRVPVQTLGYLEPKTVSVAFSHNSSLVAASGDEIIRLWRADGGDCIREFKGHHERVNSIAFSHNSWLIASASDDCTVCLWHTDTGQRIQELKGHNAGVNSVAFSHDSSIIASASRDNTIRLWHINIDSYIHEFDSSKADAEKSDYKQEMECYSDHIISSVTFSHDSSLVASLSCDNTVRIWHTDTGDCVQELKGWTSPMLSPPFNARRWLGSSCLDISHDSALIAFALDDDTISLWNINTGECMRLKSHGDIFQAISFSHDSSLIATASMDAIVLWAVNTGECVQTFMDPRYKAFYTSLAFSHGSSLVAAVSVGTIQLWAVNTGECVQILKDQTHPSGFTSAAFSHDSSLVAAASTDVIQLWRVSTGECVYGFYAPYNYYISLVSFTSNGLHLHTNFGMVTTTLEGEYCFYADGYGFNEDRSWITLNGINLLWLPPEYRSTLTAVSKSTVAVGCTSGRFWIMGFSTYTQ